MIFHAMSRGNDGKDIFLDQNDRLRFLRALSDLKVLAGFRIFAWCLMSNHFHLSIQVAEVSISEIMHRLLTRYVKGFNLKYNRVGHLFQSRFTAPPCTGDTHLLQVIRYIHQNPVRAGLVKDPADWAWSGHRDYLGLSGAPLTDAAFPLSLFSSDKNRAAELYKSFVGIEPADETAKIQAVLSEDGADSFMPPLATERPTLTDLARAACLDAGFPFEEFVSGSRRLSSIEARRLFVWKSTAQGYRPAEIATFIRRDPSTISKILHSR